MAVPLMPADSQPVAGPVREQLVEPFVRAIRLTLVEMAGIGVAVRAVYQTNNLEALDDVAAVVELSSATPRLLVLSFPRRSAAALAAQILSGVTQAEHEKLVGDCVGELANVVAGHAKTALAATPFKFTCSLPKVFDTSAGSPVHDRLTGRPMAILECAAGEFGLRLVLTL
jgi:CheY-specific phosphatase CheX